MTFQNEVIFKGNGSTRERKKTTRDLYCLTFVALVSEQHKKRGASKGTPYDLAYELAD